MISLLAFRNEIIFYLLVRAMNIHKGPVISVIGQFSSISTSSQLAKILGHLPES